MDIFSVISMLGGLAFFLYGMNVLSNGLEKIAGGKLEQILKRITSNPFKSMMLGAGITAVIQSSSAITVMLVGLVNSGIMSFSQSIGVIMGTNIGTTMTPWILSLAGLEGSNIFVKFLKPDTFSPILAFIGIIMIMVAKQGKKIDIGKILIGFAVLMYGMEIMGDAVEPLAESESFASILTAFTNPVLGVVVGTVFTGVIQSSSASVGILQALSMTGNISYGMAIPLIMGFNIGTCVTSLLSSIGVSTSAKRVSVIHIAFNIIGTLICLIVFYLLHAVIGFEFVTDSIDLVGIAVVHTLFNVVTTVILLPFSKQLEKLALVVLKDISNEQSAPELIDERLLSTPTVAISRCHEITVDMAKMAKDGFCKAMELLSDYNEADVKAVDDFESRIDNYEDKIGSYLVKLSRRSLSVENSHTVSNLLHTIGDFERIGDHACNLVRVAEEIHRKGIAFSKEAASDIKVITKALEEILDLTLTAFANNDLNVAKKIEPLEQVIDRIQLKMKNQHIARLQKGECTIESGFIFNDLLTNYERVADHCSNVAVCLIQVADDSFETHEYLNNMKTHGDNNFDEMYRAYKEKYKI